MDSITAHADPEGSAPWAMQIVVRTEKGEMPTTSDVCAAAAAATLSVIYDDGSAPNMCADPAVTRWLDGRIRKLVRRARGSRWDAALLCAPNVVVTVGSATVAAFLPRATDDVPVELSRLQVSGLVLDDPERRTCATLVPPSVTVAVAPGLELHAHPGKAAAQVAHAAQIAAERMGPDRRERWRLAGWPVKVIWPDIDVFLSSWVDAPVTIHDAGFTVVAAGSHTASARWV